MASPGKRSSFWETGGSAFLVAAALCGGCSVLFHADPGQCSSSTDCLARGTAFRGYTCVQGSCIAPQCLRDLDCAAMDAALASYVCNSQNVCVRPTPLPEAGVDSGVDTGTGGDSGPPCNVNGDCIPADPTHPEVACDVDTHSCLQLTSKECPLVVGDLSATTFGAPNYVGPATILGAFIVIPQGAPTSHPSYLDYKLALDEFRTNSGGIPTGTTTNPLRIPLAVGCDVQANLDNAMQHLINDVHVPVVVSALPTVALQSVFLNYTYPNQILTINALAADSTFASLTTGGYLWHMLGQPSDMAPAYAAFMPLLENYLRGSSSPQTVVTGAPLKVVTVTANATATNNLASAVEKVLTWNGGQTIAQNGANYLAITLPDSTLNGTAPNDSALVAAENAAANTIAQFHPNIVISFASLEFDQLIQDIEIDKDSGDQPFYLVGPYNVGDNVLLQAVHNSIAKNNVRIAGVGFASVPLAYQQILADYVSRFNAAYPSAPVGSTDEENYYDAMYFAVYSLLYAGKTATPVGADVKTGMLHLTQLGQLQYSVGPADQGNIFGVLGSHGYLQLNGTLGPPTFDTTTGSRISSGDVYCFQHADAGATYVFDYDVLRLVNNDGSSPSDGGSPFTGSFPCFPGIQ